MIGKHLPNAIKLPLKRVYLRMQKRAWRRASRKLGPLEIKYLPYKHGEHAFTLPKRPPPAAEMDSEGLPLPPREWFFEYGRDAADWLSQGKAHVKTMLDAVRGSGASFERGDRILEVGCGCGRMLRHLKSLTSTCEVWGTDVWAEQVYWSRDHLGPHGFNFATTTMIPHLPFEDRSFKLIYCGSVFTHIDDLAEAWLLEIRRLLSPDGRAYITVHDNSTVELLRGPWKSYWLARQLELERAVTRFPEDYGMLVFGRDVFSMVFYDRDYLCRNWGKIMDIISIMPEAYTFQTAILLKRKPAKEA
jgi:ubiquinone/menaquinone biosynthesis C-methylase UbiE